MTDHTHNIKQMVEDAVAISDTTLKGIVDLGLSLAESGRRDEGDLEKYWDLVEERVGDRITFTDAADAFSIMSDKMRPLNMERPRKGGMIMRLGKKLLLRCS